MPDNLALTLNSAWCKPRALYPCRNDFSFEQGAAFPLQGMTAHYLIHVNRNFDPQLFEFRKELDNLWREEQKSVGSTDLVVAPTPPIFYSCPCTFL
jgi:hypothetical protein